MPWCVPKASAHSLSESLLQSKKTTSCEGNASLRLRLCPYAPALDVLRYYLRLLSVLHMTGRCGHAGDTKDCGKLDKQANGCDLPTLSNVLMANDGFRYTFRLLNWCMQILGKEIECEESAIELKGHFCGGDVLISGANVVEKAGQEIGLIGKVPIGKLLSVDSFT